MSFFHRVLRHLLLWVRCRLCRSRSVTTQNSWTSVCARILVDADRMNAGPGNRARVLVCIAAAWWSLGVAAASPREGAARPPSDPPIDECVNAASTRHGVNPDLLLAILRVESGLKADPVRRNANGSIDVGIAQINSIHFPELRRHGVEWPHLLKPCVGIFVAAWHLKNQVLRHGNTWFAVGAYHSVTPQFNQAYRERVMRELRRMGKLTP